LEDGGRLLCIQEYDDGVIPTLLLVGLIFGHWWRVVVPLAVIAWVASLVLADIGSGSGFVVSAASLAAANVIVGVALNRGLRSLFGSFFRSNGPATDR
jgi:hypothetical protein